MWGVRRVWAAGAWRLFQVSSLQGAGGALPALPRAVLSSAGSADSQVPALLPPVLPVHHTLGLVVKQSWALLFGAWQVGCSKRRFWEFGSCQLLVGEDSICTPWPSAAFPSYGMGRRQTQAGSFVFLKIWF